MSKVQAVVVVRSALDEWNRRDSSQFHTDVSGESMTKQEFKDDCDINVIIRRFMDAGEFPEATLPPQFADVTGMDFREMLDRVREADEAFAALPAHVRRRFDNSPQEFVEFCSDPANRAEMFKLGLVERKVDKDERERVPSFLRRSTDSKESDDGEGNGGKQGAERGGSGDDSRRTGKSSGKRGQEPSEGA